MMESQVDNSLHASWNPAMRPENHEIEVLPSKSESKKETNSEDIAPSIKAAPRVVQTGEDTLNSTAPTVALEPDREPPSQPTKPLFEDDEAAESYPWDTESKEVKPQPATIPSATNGHPEVSPAVDAPPGDVKYPWDEAETQDANNKIPHAQDPAPAVETPPEEEKYPWDETEKKINHPEARQDHAPAPVESLFASSAETEEKFPWDQAEQEVPESKALTPEKTAHQELAPAPVQSLFASSDDAEGKFPWDQPEQNQEPVALVAETAQQDASSEAKAVEAVKQPADGSAWDAVFDDEDFLAEDQSDELLEDSSPDSGLDSPSSFMGSLNNGGTYQQPEILARWESPKPPQGETDARNGAQQPASNPYAPHQPSTSDFALMSPTMYGNVGLSKPALAPFSNSMSRPAGPAHTESFVDQSKGGYKSPYDLPMDISKPRKRVQMHQPSAPKPAIPPPRSSSITAPTPPIGYPPNQSVSPYTPSSATFESMAPPSQGPPPTPQRHVTPVGQQIPQPKGNTPSFFEELPVTSKPRTPLPRYTPVQSGPPKPVTPMASKFPVEAAQTQMPPPPIPTHPTQADPYAQFELQRPERLDLYANISPPVPPMPAAQKARYSPAPPAQPGVPKRYSPAPPSAPAAALPQASQLSTSQFAPSQPSSLAPSQAIAIPPQASARYSPAPGSQGSPPTGPPRYSPAPPPAPQTTKPPVRQVAQPLISPPIPSNGSQGRYPSQPVATNILSFQPRTSSPLAFHGKQPEAQNDLRANANYLPSAPARPPFHEGFSSQTSPTRAPPPLGPGFEPPRRSQTQSPGKRNPVSNVIKAEADQQRPASHHGQSPTQPAFPYQTFPAQPSTRQRGMSQVINFIPPTDGSETDELKRWQGAPLLRFDLGGTALSTFPRHVPRYATGSVAPLIKSMSGELHVRGAKLVFPLPDHVVKFPGPLKSKSKKKEVVAWLAERIAAMEITPMPSFSAETSDLLKRHDERVLLWKVVHAIVERDGAVSSKEVQEAVHQHLFPGAAASTSEAVSVLATGSGMYQPGSTLQAEAVDPSALENVRRALLAGDREKAIWTAVDHRLWAQAMLIASTMDKSVWKQVAHEYVRQEIKGAPNGESLGALYQIFAGNMEESIDELVPPSARAGLQMVNKDGSAGPPKGSLDGLEGWRETLGLILQNRVFDDHKALASLGKLLGSYGRVEAAHICHLFATAGSPTVGGADDPQASIVLLGADHINHPQNFHLDDDAVLLTEVYEYATTVLASKPGLLPHLQAYKLQRAKQLAEAGYRPEALAYCEMMGSGLRTNTKVSPYYHQQFFGELDELTQRLSQTQSESSSWMSKPSMGKVSNSVWNKFTNFVAGDESDAASAGSGQAGHEVGPFAKVAGTPTMSRSGSSTDLYSAFGGGPLPTPNTVAASKYAPTGQFSSARSSSELTRGRPSLDSQRSPSYMPQGASMSTPYDSSFGQQTVFPSMAPPSGSPYAPLNASPLPPIQSTPSPPSYVPMMAQGQSSPYKPREQETYIPAQQADYPASYQPSPALAPAPEMTRNLSNNSGMSGISQGQYPASQSTFQHPMQNTVQEPASAYTPPSQGQDQGQSYGYGYEPPSSEYVPYVPEPDSDTNTFAPKPSSSAPELISPPSTSTTDSAAARKAANDAAADAAFAAAAAADSQRGKDNPNNTLKAKSSWFGFLSRGASAGGTIPSNPSPASSDTQAGKVIRAKLGDESSFVYNKDLKMWVDSKNPNAAAEAAAKRGGPPPPPKTKGPIGRVVSESRDSLPLPPLSGSGLSSPSNSRPGSAGSPGPIGLGVGVGMGMMAPPTPPPGAALPRDGRQSAPPGAGGRPTPPTLGAGVGAGVKKTESDIDDLLGGMGPGGGSRTFKGKAKKGRGRYVDVMAQ